MIKKTYKLFSNCIPVIGHNRGVIYDLNRKDYFFISKEMANYLKNATLLNETNLIKYSFDKGFDYQLLLDNHLIFEIDHEDEQYFPPIDLTFESPFHITNTVIEFSEELLNNKTVLSEVLLTCLCRHVLIIINDNVNIESVFSFLSSFENNDFKSFSFSLSEKQFKCSNSFSKKIKDIPYLTDVFIHSARIGKVEYKSHNNYGVRYVFSEYSNNQKRKEKEMKNSFRVDLNLFIESQNYNTFYNKKMFISSSGDISNSFDGMKFCSILDYNIVDKILNIVKSDSYNIFSSISKDKIEICNQCEFRYMCVDDRLPQYTSLDTKLVSLNNSCAYNPLKSEWT